MDFFLQTFNILVDLLIALLFIRVIFSWFGGLKGKLGKLISDATNPILKPIQRLMPRTGFIDLSPLVAFILLEVLRNIVNRLLI